MTDSRHTPDPDDALPQHFRQHRSGESRARGPPLCAFILNAARPAPPTMSALAPMARMVVSPRPRARRLWIPWRITERQAQQARIRGIAHAGAGIGGDFELA